MARIIRIAAVALVVAASLVAAQDPTTAAPAPNCVGWGGTGGATCTADEDCCGAGTMYPQCIPKNSGKQCCTHYKAAAACNSTQTCCGALGPGASSYAFCCNEGSTCCHAMSYTQGATCCPSGSTCCAGASIGLCCASDEVCEASMNRCSKVTTTTTAPTVAPVPETTAAPNCPAYGGSSGATCTADEDCCGAGTMFPQCIAKNSGKQCCVHYKGATTCNSTQTCCGSYGPGAGSSAFCCNEGSSCCHAMSQTQGSSCCPSGTTCCAGASIGLCCASDEVCEPNMNRCSKVSSTAPAVPSQ